MMMVMVMVVVMGMIGEVLYAFSSAVVSFYFVFVRVHFSGHFSFFLEITMCIKSKIYTTDTIYKVGIWTLLKVYLGSHNHPVIDIHDMFKISPLMRTPTFFC